MTRGRPAPGASMAAQLFLHQLRLGPMENFVYLVGTEGERLLRHRLLWLVPTLLAWSDPWPTARAASVMDHAGRCLALAPYWEAKTEGPEGMRAVASVVLNRVAHPEFPDTVCAVVTQGGEQPPCQFSWWCDGKSDQPTDARAWRLARQIAQAALAKAPPDRTVRRQNGWDR